MPVARRARLRAGARVPPLAGALRRGNARQASTSPPQRPLETRGQRVRGGGNVAAANWQAIRHVTSHVTSHVTNHVTSHMASHMASHVTSRVTSRVNIHKTRDMTTGGMPGRVGRVLAAIHGRQQWGL